MEQRIDPYLAHEALDRCHVIACLLDDHLIQHPFVQQDNDVRKLLCAASDALGAAYQMIGGSRRSKHLDTPNAEVSGRPSGRSA